MNEEALEKVKKLDENSKFLIIEELSPNKCQAYGGNVNVAEALALVSQTFISVLDNVGIPLGKGIETLKRGIEDD